MAKRLFVLYAVVEMAVIIALVVAIGFGWTVLLLAATFGLGLVVAGSQLRRQLAVLRSGVGERGVTDGMLVALGSVLTFIPGLVTSAAGLLMLLPPTRGAMRPLAGRTLGRYIPVSTQPDYIDGEVIDVHDVDAKYLPQSDPARDETAAQRPLS